MDKQKIFHKILPYVVAIAAMVVVASIYFSPAWEGKTLRGDDVIKGGGIYIGKSNYKMFENDYRSILWNDRYFSGMPEIGASGIKGTFIYDKIYRITTELLGIPYEIHFLFWYMLGFFILLRSMRINIWLALAGAIVFSLCTYNLLIIEVGHNSKVRTISMIPPTLAGILLIFRKKYLWGFLITSYFIGMQIKFAHIQMSYYFIIAICCLLIVELFYHIKEKKIKNFLIVNCLIAICGFIGLAPNLAKIATTYKYSKHSIRGKSELTINNPKNVKTKKGLDKDYINVWSSEKIESLMLFVPNIKGGVSQPIKHNKSISKKLPAKYKNFIGNMNQYWGNQPFTAGPYYMGSVVCFLFILGLFLIKGRLKQTVLVFVALSIMLSWGGNFSWFTNIFIDHIPLYSKFRAPISILAITAIFIVMFAMYFLHQTTFKSILNGPKKKIPLFNKPQPLYLVVGGGFLGVLLLLIAFPQVFNEFINQKENQQLSSIAQKNNAHKQVSEITAALIDFRIKIFRTELWRTSLFIGLSILLLYLYAEKKIKPYVFVALISILMIIDIWKVDTRYINDSNFSKVNRIVEEYKLNNIDRRIYQNEIKSHPVILSELKNLSTAENIQKYSKKLYSSPTYVKSLMLMHSVYKHTHYRVFNTRNPFNENKTSSAHASIGGYCAYKMRRYQDLIELHLSKGNKGVLNMLNTKYITNGKGLQVNRDALGPAWFVNSVLWVNSADEEILALNKIDTKNTIVVHSRDKKLVKSFSPQVAGDYIKLTSKIPDKMTYEIKAKSPRLVVFSEIYYPDWKLYINGKKAPYFRANYVLRSAIIPAGKHKVEFVYEPLVFHLSNNFSGFAAYLYIFIFLGVIGWKVYNNFFKKSKTASYKN